MKTTEILAGSVEALGVVTRSAVALCLSPLQPVARPLIAIDLLLLPTAFHVGGKCWLL